MCPIRAGIYLLHELLRTLKPAIDNVNMMYLWAAQDQSQPDMPSRLLAGTKYRYRMHFFTPVEDQCRGKRSAECGQFFCGNDGIRGTGRGEQCQRASRGGALRAEDRGVGGGTGGN